MADRSQKKPGDTGSATPGDGATLCAFVSATAVEANRLCPSTKAASNAKPPVVTVEHREVSRFMVCARAAPAHEPR